MPVRRATRLEPSMSRLRTLVMLVPALALLSASANAQVVTGTITERDSTTPAVGTIVQLVDASGQPVVQALSRDGGEFLLRAPAAGRYRVRVLRIGFRPTLSAPVAVAADQVATVRVALAGAPVSLSPILVSASRVCRVNPDSGSQTADVWQEARKALAASVLSREDREYDMRVGLFERQTDARGRITASDQWEREGNTPRPFQTVSADTLARFGFVHGDAASGITYFGADADLLLSDAFAREHCLHLDSPPGASGDSAQWIGLAFEPIRHDPERPDIRGVLWVDRGSSELRRLDFHYTDLQAPFDAADPGGEVRFLRLPNGSWVVSRWTIRMPLLAAREERPAYGGFALSGAQLADRLRVTVKGMQFSGGELLRVRRRSESVWVAADNGIAAVLVDSGTGRPRRGVQVELRRTSRAAVTDTAGRFSFSGLLAGSYGLITHDPVLDSLGIASPRTTVMIPDSGIASVRVAIPSRDVAADERCGGKNGEHGALLRLVVLDSATARPITDAHVLATWTRLMPPSGSGEATIMAFRREGLGDGGGYSLCDVPRDLGIDVEIRVPGRRTLLDRPAVPSSDGYRIVVERVGL